MVQSGLVFEEGEAAEGFLPDLIDFSGGWVGICKSLDPVECARVATLGEAVQDKKLEGAFLGRPERLQTLIEASGFVIAECQ